MENKDRKIVFFDIDGTLVDRTDPSDPAECSGGDP